MFQFFGKVALSAAAMLVMSSAASAATFNLTGNSPTDGADGNVRTFSAGGVSVKVTGYSIKARSTGPELKTAYVGAYGGGLGITDRDESGTNPSHTVDNNGLDEFLLFQFSEDVIVSEFGFSAYGDTDFSYSIASTNTPFSTLYTLGSYSDFSSKFIPTIDVSGPSGSNGAYVDQTVNGAKKSGNLLVIAASLLASTSNDAFKVKSLSFDLPPPPPPVQTSVPEPTTWAMMIGGLGLIGFSMRRRKVVASFA